MHDELQAVVDEFESARTRLHSLAESVSGDAWALRAAPGRWSAGECVAHLNLTSAVYLPILDQGIARARQLPGPVVSRYRRDPAGWLLWKTTGPPVRFRVKTAAAFVPGGSGGHAAPDQLVADFDRFQAEQIARVRAADGLPIDRVKITSPFDRRVKYNLYACLTILPRHQHRHLWQAEQASLASKG